MAWGDFDNDGILDLAAGNESGGYPNRIYRGIFHWSNAGPSSPADDSDLSVSISGGSLQLTWGDGNDPDVADKDSLYYDIFLATEPYANSPAVLVVSTQPRSPLFGPYMRPRNPSPPPPHRITLGNFIQLQQDNTYYFRVATIDSSFQRSDWSVEKSTFLSGDSTAPNAVTDLGVTAPSEPSRVDLTWTAPGDDGGSGNLSGEFRIAYTTITADAQNPSYWSTSTAQVTISTSGVSAGSSQSGIVKGLDQGGATYYFRVWSRDDALNWSSLSDGATTWVKGWSANWSATDEFADNATDLAWGDYDGDGYPDLVVANSNSGSKPNRVYRNNGDGTMTLVWSGTSEQTDDTQGIAWGDMDNDGDLDFVTGNQGAVLPSRVYRNDGGGTFALAWSGTDEQTDWGYGVDWGDFDNDGDQDFLVTNHISGQSNRIYRNEGQGSFTLAWSSPNGAKDGSRSAAWGDYDRDGDLDFAVSNPNTSTPNRVFRNDGDADFVLVWSSVGEQDSGEKVVWGDIDNDGDLDLVFGVNLNTKPNRVYRNDGGGVVCPSVVFYR